MADVFYSVKISAGGASYDASGDVISLTITQSESGADALSLTLEDPYKLLAFAVEEGRDVEVQLGTLDDHPVLFQGEVHAIKNNHGTGLSSLSIEASDPLMLLGYLKNERSIDGEDLESIVRAVCSTYKGFALDLRTAGNPKLTQPKLKQPPVTDLAFLTSLAKDSGCLLYFDQESASICFVNEKALAKGWVLDDLDQPIVLRHDGLDARYPLLTFDGKFDLSQIVLPTSYKGTDSDGNAMSAEPQGMPSLVATRTPSPDFVQNLAQLSSQRPDLAAALEALATVDTQTQVRQRMGKVEYAAPPSFWAWNDENAQALNDITESSRFTRKLGMADGVLEGTPRMRARASVKMENVGSSFDGNWFVSSVRHVLDRSGYRTEFDGRKWDDS